MKVLLSFKSLETTNLIQHHILYEETEEFHVVFTVHLDINFQLFELTNALFYFRTSVQFTLHVSAVTRPSSRYVDKFTSLFTSPFGIITTVTLFEAMFTLTLTSI
jgi:hypothetical protein